MTDKNKTLEIDGPLMRQIIEEQASFKDTARTVALWAFTVVATAVACLAMMVAFYFAKITGFF